MKKQKLQKKIMAVFLCMLMILSGSACARNQGKETDNKMQEMENDTHENSKTAEDSQGNEENKKNGEEKDKDSKEIIKLYTNSMYDPWLTKAVEYFNEQNEAYQIEVTGCSGRRRNEDGKIREPEEVLQIETERQGEPDILYWLSNRSWSNDSIIKKYARGGLLADLSPFLEQGEEPLVESYDKKILKASKIDGKLYQLPYSFELKVLLGNKKMMGDKESWTMEEMLSLYKKLPESFMYMMDISKKNYIGDVFCYQQSDYRDHDTGKFHVETEDFMNMLRFAKELPDKTAEDTINILCSSKWIMEKMIPKGQLLLTRETIAEDDIEDSYSKSYEEYYKKAGGCNILSYPSTKNNGILMDVAMLPFAILESSKYKEKAWELLRFADNYVTSLILEEDEDLRIEEFSVKKDVLEKSLKRYRKKNREKVKALLKRVGRIRTDHDLKYPLDYHTHAFSSESDYEDTEKETKAVLEIIMKNAEKYFKGEESVEKATKKIQKKLDELERNMQEIWKN